MPTPPKHASSAERQKAYRLRTSEARLQELRIKGLPTMPSLPAMPGTRRWTAMRKQAQALLLSMISEMETYRDGRSDNWQTSEKADALEEIVAQAQEVCDLLEALKSP
jgi:hypothetical protein